MTREDTLIVANCSGFYGDRLSAAEEVVGGGPIDVLTGDYLAELTMALLARARQKDPEGGYVPTFVAQMERVMGACLERKIRVVANAGGLNPRGLARALGALGERLGLRPKIAYLEGDDLVPRLAELEAAGEPLCHMDRGTPLAQARKPLLTANAYLGAWGIREALAMGADIVVCPRVTDAALVAGPAAWKFGWAREDWDRMAGAVAAGHILECGPQATGGNYPFLDEVPSFERMGFPLAEMRADGSFVVTKHPGTGGLVSVGTVTAQLLYEIRGPRYLSPDVVARFDSLTLEQEGPDRVRVSGARGEPPPRTSKVAINLFGGHRNAMTVLLTGLDIEKKAAIVEQALFAALGGRGSFDRVDVSLLRRDRADPESNEQAVAELRVAVHSQDERRVGRAFSSRVVEMAVSSVAGFTLAQPPRDASPYLVYWPALVGSQHLPTRVVLGDEIRVVAPLEGVDAPAAAAPRPAPPAPSALEGPFVRLPLGRLFGARSGDKGGSANVGVWARTPAAYAFLCAFLTGERLGQLLPDVGRFAIERHELPNLLALNFFIDGLLGEGVASSSRLDPQAKTLGEYLRAIRVDLPLRLVEAELGPGAVAGA